MNDCRLRQRLLREIAGGWQPPQPQERPITSDEEVGDQDIVVRDGSVLLTPVEDGHENNLSAR